MEASSLVPKIYAIEITPDTREIIALLNRGVVPELAPDAYFVFDATWNSDMPSVVMEGRDIAKRWNMRNATHVVLKLEEPVGVSE